MKNHHFEIEDLGVTMEADYKAESMQSAEMQCRSDYAIDLDCSPEDVKILSKVQGKAIDITKQDIRCCDELTLEHGIVNATYELWFDVDAYFGTDTKGFDEEWINFYTDWNPVTNDITATLTINKPDTDEERSWPLTKKEKAFFLGLMESYCKKTCDCDLKKFWIDTMTYCGFDRTWSAAQIKTLATMCKANEKDKKNTYLSIQPFAVDEEAEYNEIHFAVANDWLKEKVKTLFDIDNYREWVKSQYLTEQSKKLFIQAMKENALYNTVIS